MRLRIPTCEVMVPQRPNAHVVRMQTPLHRFLAAPVQYADLGTTRMAYRVFGSGPALVFVHGWPLSGVTFRSLIDGLRHEFTCYVPDLPGAGQTGWDDTVRDLFTDGAARIGALIDTLGLQRFGLIGFDSGGAIARLVAAERPGRVFAMVLTNTETPGHMLPLMTMLQRAARLPGATAIFRGLLRSRAFLRSRFGFAGTLKDLDHLEGDFKEASLQPLQSDPSGPLQALRHANLHIADELGEVHARIDAPLLCVWGDRCGFFPVSGAEAMVEAWPAEARLVVLSGHKLLVHEEDPDAVLRAMIPFLRAHAHGHLAELSAE